MTLLVSAFAVDRMGGAAQLWSLGHIRTPHHDQEIFRLSGDEHGFRLGW